MSDRPTCCAASPAPEDRWDAPARRRPRRPRRARVPLEPPRRRPRAREHRRRQHVCEGDDDRPRRPRGAGALGEGLRAPTWRRSRPRASPACASTSSPAARSGGDGRRDDGRVPAALRRCARTSRGRRSRRCCTRSSPAPHVDHTHPDAVIALTSTPDGRALAAEAFGDEAVWLDYQRPGFDMSRRIALLLEEHPQRARGAAREARARHLGRDAARRVTARRSSSSPVPPGRSNGRRGAGSGWGARKVAELGERTRSPPLATSLPALRGALLADADGVVLEVDRSPEAVAFASSARAPEVSQVGAPCPDHLINTKHRPLVVRLRPRLGRRGRAGRRLPARESRSTAAWYREYYERNLDDETRPFPIDPAGPRVVLVPGVGIVTRRGRGPRAGRARPLPPRDRGRGRRRRARRLPLAQRGGGVRDRVLAARALQARAGAAARASSPAGSR